jgi:hypothetical protein
MVDRACGGGLLASPRALAADVLSLSGPVDLAEVGGHHRPSSPWFYPSTTIVAAHFGIVGARILPEPEPGPEPGLEPELEPEPEPELGPEPEPELEPGPGPGPEPELDEPEPDEPIIAARFGIAADTRRGAGIRRVAEAMMTEPEPELSEPEPEPELEPDELELDAPEPEPGQEDTPEPAAER